VDGTLEAAPMLADDGSGRYRHSGEWVMVTAPDEVILKTANKLFGTAFTMDQFAGR